MSASHIARHTSFGSVALLLLTLAASRAEAQEVQTFTGSSCQASGSAQDLYYSGVSVANRNGSTSSAVCPLVRANGTADWLAIAVFVRDRHATQNISCIAQARDPSGVAGSGWSETQSTAGEGDQVLVFGVPGAALPAVRTLRRHLLASTDGEQPSVVHLLDRPGRALTVRVRGRRATRSPADPNVLAGLAETSFLSAWFCVLGG